MYYQLADACALGVFVGTSLDEPQVFDGARKRIEEVTALAVKFLDAAEEFIATELKAQGAVLTEHAPPES